MKRLALLLMTAAVAGCAETSLDDGETTSATFSLSQSGAASLGSALPGSPPGDSTVRFGGNLIRRSAIDSLIVIVTRVDVLPDSEILRCHPPVGDSVRGFRPGQNPDGPGSGPLGPPPGACGRGRRHHGPGHPPRPDTLVPRDSGWGAPQRHWYSLDVVGSGKLDLMALPTDSNSGLVLAAGSLPVGEYGAARLIVRSAKIWFDTVITTANGFTFQPDTEYDVKLPIRRDSVQMIMTREGFTLEAGGADVVLVFDPHTTIGNAGVNANGEIMIRPVLQPHRPRR